MPAQQLEGSLLVAQLDLRLYRRDLAAVLLHPGLTVASTLRMASVASSRHGPVIRDDEILVEDGGRRLAAPHADALPDQFEGPDAVGVLWLGLFDEALQSNQHAICIPRGPFGHGRPTPSRARRPPACSDRRGSARLGERSPGGRVGHAGPARQRPLVRSAEASGRRRRWAGALRAPGGPRFALRHYVPSFAANPLRRRQ